jgi:hypothetical protein
VLPAGSLRQRETVLLRSGRDHHECRCLRRGGLALGVSSRAVTRREMGSVEVSQDGRSWLSDGLALLGAAARGGDCACFLRQKG